MKKQMNAVSVEIHSEADEIHLVQPGGADGNEVIVIHPDQAEILCDWIIEAARKLTSDCNALLAGVGGE